MPSLIRIKYVTQDDKASLVRLSELPEKLRPGNEIRKVWVDKIRKFVVEQDEMKRSAPLAFVLGLDGEVEKVEGFGGEFEEAVDPAARISSKAKESTYNELLAAQVSGVGEDVAPQSYTSVITTYPASYRIPSGTISRFPNEEGLRRAHLFAFGSMMYEIYSEHGKPPFDGISDSDVQSLFGRALFPEVTSLPQWPIILSCWSTEFAKELHKILGIKQQSPEGFTQKAGTYIKKHPVLFGVQVASAAVGLAGIIALPILGAVGFGALGPAAGSAAAAWQASIGIVEAGSIFAWCQSAAMGGAAVGGIIAAGVGGGSLLVSSTAWALLMEGEGDGVEEGDLRERLLEKFQEVCLRADPISRI